MTIKSCNKLVRDEVPTIIITKGEKPKIHILSNVDFMKELKIKLQEEVNEFLANESMEELADIQEVIHGILFAKNKTFAELEKVLKQKKKECGGFEKKIFLECIEK